MAAQEEQRGERQDMHQKKPPQMRSSRHRSRITRPAGLRRNAVDLRARHAGLRRNAVALRAEFGAARPRHPGPCDCTTRAPLGAADTLTPTPIPRPSLPSQFTGASRKSQHLASSTMGPCEHIMAETLTPTPLPRSSLPLQIAGAPAISLKSQHLASATLGPCEHITCTPGRGRNADAHTPPNPCILPAIAPRAMPAHAHRWGGRRRTAAQRRCLSAAETHAFLLPAPRRCLRSAAAPLPQRR